MRTNQTGKYLVLGCISSSVILLGLYTTFRTEPINLHSDFFKVQCVRPQVSDSHKAQITIKGGGGSSDETERLSDRLEEWEVCSGDLHIAQNDTRLINYIREYHLIPPSEKEYDLTSKHPEVDAVWRDLVAKHVIKILKYKKSGFFIECAANDGQFLSNTLLMEKDYEWSGLLIEADPGPLQKLVGRHRKSWIANVCLSITPYPMKTVMLRHKEWETLSFVPKFNIWRSILDYDRYEAQCFPFLSILSALDLTIVDYFSLDVEGAELLVLKGIPFESVFIKVFSIEVTPETAGPIQRFMSSKGYVLDNYIAETHTHDQIYIHRSLT